MSGFIRRFGGLMIVPVLLIGVAACSSSSTSSTTSSSSTTKASASAYFNCLREHGVTAGTHKHGSASASPSDSASASAGPAPSPASSATVAAAKQACASLRPAGGTGFGHGGEVSSATLTADVKKFESCVTSHGVTLSSSSSSESQTLRSLIQLSKGSAADKAAFSDCQSDLPFGHGEGKTGASASSSPSTSS